MNVSQQVAERPDASHPRPITVVINYKPYEFDRPDQTAMSIKQGAIALGAEIQVGFVLSVKRGSHYVALRDDEKVHLHKEMQLLAVAPDDNS